MSNNSEIKNIFSCTAEEALESFEQFMTRAKYTDSTKALKRTAVQKWINEMFGRTKQKTSTKEKQTKKPVKTPEKPAVKETKTK